MTHRFTLEPYKGLNTRYTCPNCNQQRCFSHYIDLAKTINFPNHVGRCNREQKCGYHFKPKDFFAQKSNINNTFLNYKDLTNSIKCQTLKPSFIDIQMVNRTLTNYSENKLFQFLSSKLGSSVTIQLMQRYLVGTANHWQGSTVFWQVDFDLHIRTGKIILYSSKTGRRIKKPFNHITWVHSLLHSEEFNLKQCFFGEHLLLLDTIRPVAIVESEKSALVASYYLPQFLWLATGGKNGCFRQENLKVLQGRNVVLFPDLGATEYWNQKTCMMKDIGIEVIVFDYIEKSATPEQRNEGYDIVDFLLETKQPKVNLQSIIEENKVLKLLIKGIG